MNDTNKSMDYYFHNNSNISTNRGPCGKARNAFGFSPSFVGAQYIPGMMCASSEEDCKKCPLNPNNKK